MTFYLSSPGQQIQADYCRDMPVLLSYALYPKQNKLKGPWLDDWIPSFSRILIDSGAYSELTGKATVDGYAYKAWCDRWSDISNLDAVAGLDDISGDWKRSLRNYELFGGFPTYHETDPPELLDELVPLARERGSWLGVGLLPPRSGKWTWVKATLARIPDDLHVHFWAGGEYSGHPRVNSCDSTNWFRDAWKYKTQLPFLTPGECLELVIKRYQRTNRKVINVSEVVGLFGMETDGEVS